MTEPKRIGRPAQYTPAERIERRKACKASSDSRRKASATVRNALDAEIKEKTAKRIAGSASAEEFIANGGDYEVLQACRYVPSKVMPLGPRYGAAA